jgi:hypothetical protein
VGISFSSHCFQLADGFIIRELGHNWLGSCKSPPYDSISYSFSNSSKQVTGLGTPNFNALLAAVGYKPYAESEDEVSGKVVMKLS